MSERYRQQAKSVLRLFIFMGFIFIFISFVILSIPLAPLIYYKINSNATNDEIELISTPLSLDITPGYLEDLKELREKKTIPPLDQTLPTQNILLIPTIKVEGQIQEGDNFEEALDKGIWRVTNFGDPENNEVPIIIAAHRFGNVTWSSNFRETNSFYNLPNTKVGDKIIIIWKQRKYEYEIIEAFDSTYIDNYNVDLILYTCRMFNSPIRIFRYAKRVN